MSMVMENGDKVVCIDDGGVNLTLHKVYDCIGVNEYYININNDFDFSRNYYLKRFISLSEFRRMKLVKLGMRL